ncbi:FAD-binding protein [Mycobacterium sp. AZCC_0083]|uniref:FAD-binding protein n=1 Tax=Mycobacterium sp. AZCC_0083 TaxID=2735882 RepID=UPI001614BD12|nr:FAD-binding protein [Mycobacterium sp. AZCC_0083]MBB5167701.1 antitoxin (DNA-binding transcriptional repressor) of toxin-antitoxin stability system [Mycobacterium sp. AZCC_0083]
MWDTEVDLVCIGAGIGGLATAIATVDAGEDVIVADTGQIAASVATHGGLGAARGWLQHDGVDVETEDFLAAVVEGLDPLARRPGASRVPTRVARPWTGDGRSVEPFVGATIRAWDIQCLGSPYGTLHSSVFGWQRTRMRSSDGEAIEVIPVGEIDWHDGLGEHDLLDWMGGQAYDRDVEVLSASSLQRIVFEEGLIVGVVLDTPDGPYAVGTRRGVTLSPPDNGPAAAGQLTSPSQGDRKQVCLVGRSASRFGRVELITIAAPAVVEPVCSGSGRQLRGHLRESRQVPSDLWRCGKVHGHTAFGQ